MPLIETVVRSHRIKCRYCSAITRGYPRADAAEQAALAANWLCVLVVGTDETDWECPACRDGHPLAVGGSSVP